MIVRILMMREECYLIWRATAYLLHRNTAGTARPHDGVGRWVMKTLKINRKEYFDQCTCNMATLVIVFTLLAIYLVQM
jgi:hypothetical protein